MTRPYVPDNHDLPDELERRHEHDVVVYSHRGVLFVNIDPPVALVANMNVAVHAICDTPPQLNCFNPIVYNG